MRAIDIRRITKIVLSMAELLSAGTLAVIVPEEEDIKLAYSTAEDYYMLETHLGSNRYNIIKMKSRTDVYFYSVESWKSVTMEATEGFGMIFRVKNWW